MTEGEQAQAPVPAPPPPETETEWLRLDPRMLLVHPVREVLRFLPVIIGLFVAGAATRDGTGRLQLLGILVPVALGLVRYWTTSYRIHADRVELRRGLLSTSTLATPLDRVRTVDLTASPIQRVLGLSTVRIGTGTAARLDDGGLDLDGLPTPRARALRQQLLTSIATPAADPEGTGGERLVARFEPGWLRFAPFTSAGFVIAAGLIGVGSQVLDQVGFFEDVDEAAWEGLWARVGVVAVPVVVLGLGVLVAAFAVLGYLLTNGNFAVSHTLPDGSWHVRRGVLTTRETSLDDDRLRGVSLGEPLGLRLVRGGRLSAIVTGLDRSESGSSALLPPTPRALVQRVAAEVVGTAEPVHARLVDHGPRARARRYVRAMVPAVAVAAVLVTAAAVDGLVWPAVLAAVVVLAALGLGHDRARSLGHALVDGWLVARSGSLTRRRDLLATEAVIGWNLRSTWFQRRAGLVTLVATTAGGRQWVAIPDVPEPVAVEVAVNAVPGLVDQFLATDRGLPAGGTAPVR
ncbi:PH domain-containing protein [Nocardioides coralli]|uniref:PH domain-containing protein n=1 Tax=Nocardioides coralli TaxID=2872154 RepID=UPI001CA39BC7|nr:PH domain-containing protein [Nocardioides coralli]QZY29963.1 PH domain-containing protein [Nocardioides coralli]